MASSRSPAAADFDDAAAHLLAEILRVVRFEAGEAPFPIRLETALEVALGMLEADRLLAERLTVSAAGDGELAGRLRSWAHTYGEVLREAVEADPRYHAPRPPLEPQIVAGLALQVRRALDAQASDMRLLLPRLYSFVFSYYREGGELQRYLNAFATR